MPDFSDSDLIRLQGISKSFQEAGTKRVVLNGVDMGVSRGEFVVVMGRSGSGKSTLLNLIGGIDVPDSGSVIVGGTNLTELSDTRRTRFRRRHIGIVFQSFNLIPTLTVRENVMLPLDLEARVDAQSQAAALDRLDRVELADRAETFPDRLSGGEQQRVAIARAVAHGPDLILADEPTGNLDMDTGRQVLDLLAELVRETGTTLFIATHDQALAARADRVVHLANGHLTERTAVVESA